MKAFLLLLIFAFETVYALPKGFVYVHDLAPEIIEDLRYVGSNNFIGHPIPGYKANHCILTTAAAEQLAKAEKAALDMGYTIKVYDCYRPQRAVNAFYQWSQNPKDSKMKANFYPREAKSYLFAKGYIAQASGHTRGSTIDLSLVKLGHQNTVQKKSNGPMLWQKQGLSG